MPIARPMLALIALWSFIGPFMDYLLPKVLLTSPETYSIGSRIIYIINDVRTLNQPAFAAGGLLGLFYSYIIYSITKRVGFRINSRFNKGLMGIYIV